MAEPKSESTAAVMAVIEAEISAMQWVRRLPPRMGPNSGFGPACFLPGDRRKGTREPQGGLRVDASFHQNRGPIFAEALPFLGGHHAGLN